MVAGGILLLCSTYASIVKPSTASCYVNILLIVYGYDLFYTALFIKAYRIYVLWNTNLAKEVKISEIGLFFYILISVVIDSIIVILWILISPLKDAYFLDTDKSKDFYNYYNVECSSGPEGYDIIFLSILFIYKILTILAGAYISRGIRNIGTTLHGENKKRVKRANDSYDIEFAVFNIFFVGITCLFIFILLKSRDSVTVFYITNIMIYCTVIPTFTKIFMSIIKDGYESLDSITMSTAASNISKRH